MNAPPSVAAPDNQTTYRVSWTLRARREILRILVRWIFKVLCRVKVSGFENIPSDGAYIVAYNHISLYEPPLVGSFWPEQPEALAGHDVFQRAGQNIFVRLYEAIPVRRGEYDRQAIDLMARVLQSGHPLLIAPEGGRSHETSLRRGQPGVAYLMDLLGVPVVPVAVQGTTDDMLRRALLGQRPRLHMRIGEPIQMPPIHGRGAERRAMRQANADLVMRRIAALLPPEYRGVYSD